MGVNTAAMVARRRFGEALKDVRLKAVGDDGKALKQIHIAKALGRETVDRYSRLERGQAWPEPEEWPVILEVLRADAVTKVRLHAMLQEGMEIAGAWWVEYEDEFPESLMQFIAYEDAAHKITTCSGNTIPGLLQTPDYARVLTRSLASSVLTPDAVERSVELRGKRRGILGNARLASLEAIFSEAALWQQVGGVEVMLNQLDSLIEDCAQRRLTCRIVPFEAHATSMYMVHLLEFSGADEKPIAAFDSMTGMVFRKSLKEVRESRYYLESMRGLSFSPLESVEKLKTIRKELSRAR
jgi:hypothetical protein